MIRKILRIISLLCIYQGIYFFLPVKNFLPSIVELLTSIIQNFASSAIYLHIFASVGRVLIGFTLAAVVGISLGILVGNTPKLRWLRSYIELLRPIPPIAWIPLAILFLGLGEISSYFIVFIGAFFPIFSSTYFGVSSIPLIYKNVSRSFEFSKKTYLLKVVGLYSLPYIFAGLKIGIGMAWMSVIAAELISTDTGLGYFIQVNRLLLRTDNILIGMMLIGCIGYLLNKIIEYVEKTIVRWRI